MFFCAAEQRLCPTTHPPSLPPSFLPSLPPSLPPSPLPTPLSLSQPMPAPVSAYLCRYTNTLEHTITLIRCGVGAADGIAQESLRSRDTTPLVHGSKCPVCARLSLRPPPPASCHSLSLLPPAALSLPPPPFLLGLWLSLAKLSLLPFFRNTTSPCPSLVTPYTGWRAFCRSLALLPPCTAWRSSIPLLLPPCPIALARDRAQSPPRHLMLPCSLHRVFVSYRSTSTPGSEEKRGEGERNRDRSLSLSLRDGSGGGSGKTGLILSTYGTRFIIGVL